MSSQRQRAPNNKQKTNKQTNQQKDHISDDKSISLITEIKT